MPHTPATPMELVIIGAGPAGISLAAEAILAGVPKTGVVVLEKGAAHSWAIRKFYPENKAVTANYKGKAALCLGVMCISDTSKSGLLSYLDQAIEQCGIDVRYSSTVTAISHQAAGGFIIETSEGALTAKVCAIAIGILGKPNKPSYRLPGKVKRRVHFDITTKPIEDATVLVVGGGDSASEYAQYLVQTGNRVSLSYRRDNFSRMNPINQQSLLALAERDQVTLLMASDIESLRATEAGHVAVHFKGDELGTPVFEHVVYALGGTTPQNFLKTIGIAFNEDNVVQLNGQETNIPGLYLLGDLSAGRKGGSVISAFNASRRAVAQICDSHLGCQVPGSNSDVSSFDAEPQ